MLNTYYVTQREFARLCNVDMNRITGAIRYALKHCVNKNGSVDINHPDAILYIEMGAPSTKEFELAQLNDDWEPADVPNDITLLTEKPLKYLISKFGSSAAYRDWIKTVQISEAVREKQLKNDQTTGKLVGRDWFQAMFFSPVNEFCLRLLTDGSRTITVRARHLIESGSDNNDVEKLIRELLSDYIRTLKGAMSGGISEDQRGRLDSWPYPTNTEHNKSTNSE